MKFSQKEHFKNLSNAPLKTKQITKDDNFDLSSALPAHMKSGLMLYML